MLGFEDQWPTAAMPNCPPMNDGLEYQSIASTPLSSPVDYGSENEPTSSEEDESDFEPPEPHGNNNDIQIHQTSVTLNHNHLRSDTDLEVGSIFSKGETLGIHDGSFLMITELGKSKNGRSVDFVGHLFRPIEEFKDYLPVEFSGSELVWLCEAKEHDSKPRCYLRHARSKDVLRVRQLVLTNSECAPEFPQSRATGIFTSYDGPSQSKTHGCATGRNPGICKERRRDTSRSLLLAPSTNDKRIVKATGKPAVRKSSCHLQLYLEKTASEQGIERQIYTFADAFRGAGGMSVCTVREAACVKGVPADHAFCGRLSATEKQVANAVPPPVAKAILEEVLRSLMRTDALRRS